MTIIVYLVGRAGTGKYTIAQEFAKEGFKLVDNHLILNPIFSLLDLDDVTPISDYIWQTIGKIRDVVFKFIENEPENNYVLTDELYDEYPCNLEIYKSVEALANSRKSVFIPVRLLISKEENIKRIQDPRRKLKGKQMRISNFYEKLNIITINHPNLLEIEVSNLSAGEAKSQIIEHIRKMGFGNK